MAIPKKEKPKHRETPLIPERYQHPAAIAVILLTLVLFFHEIIFDGKNFQSADNIASYSFYTLIIDANNQGIMPLWNPYIFCGMPGVASLTVSGDRFFDVSAFLFEKVSQLFGILLNSRDVGTGLFYYFVLGVGVYVLMFEKLRNKLVALLSAVGVMHSTYIIIVITVGHMTKVPVICFFPWIFLIIERLREKFSLWLALLLVLIVHFMYMPGHIQMIFYVFFALGLYFLFFFVRALIKKEQWQGIVRSAVVLGAAAGIAFAMSGDQYLSTLEYSKYSIRGSDPIVAAPTQPGVSAPSSTGGGGLDYDYATNWSFSPGEMMTFIVPSLYGFGWHDYAGVLTQNQTMRLNTYFGPSPFTDAPQYMGIIILALAVVGLWKNRKDPFVQYGGLLMVIALLISFGKEFPLVYDLMFYYFPMFNKFRIPVLILILVQLMMPILAGYGIVSLLNEDRRNIKNWSYAVAAFLGLLILSVVAKDAVLSIYAGFFPSDEVSRILSRSYGGNQAVLSELYKIIADMVAADVTAALFLLAAATGLLYLYWRNTIKESALLTGLIALVIFDLWRVNFKPMDPHPRQVQQNIFTAPAYVKFLQQDTTQYRILEFENGQPPYNNTLAYWRIQSAYGYQGAKMRQIQDVFDVVGLGNPLLWGLMNVRYIISDRPDSNGVLFPVYRGEKNVLYNRAELPRAFFVNRYEVAQGIEILNKIKNMEFDPRDVAYFMDDPKVAVDSVQQGADVTIDHYGIQDLSATVTATGNNLLFLSESWYPEGWKAFIDGTETPIHRVNYMFRAVVVPPGKHTLTMSFEPRGFYIGRQLSLWLNILVFGALVYFAVRMFLERKKSVQG